MDRGINELFEGPTISHGIDKYLFPPSSFSEAQIGFMSRQEIREGLHDAMALVKNSEASNLPAMRAILRRFERRLGRATNLDDLLEKVRAHHENSAALITKQPIKQAALSGGGVWYFSVRRRGRETGERARQVTVKLDANYDIMQYLCQCPTFRHNTAKGNYDRISEQASGRTMHGIDVAGFPTFNIMLACYHVAAALTYISRETGQYKLPFKFTNIMTLEAMFMDVFRSAKEAAIDDYLIREGALTGETLKRISDGELTLEVAKHQRNSDQRSHGIISGVRTQREKDGYTFSGFATDFRATPYQTTAVVLTKNDGRSVHVLYDSKLGVDLPLIMLNIPKQMWQDMGRGDSAAELQGNPITADRPFRGFDERTGKEVIAIIARPDSRLITPTEARIYERATRKEAAGLV